MTSTPPQRTLADRLVMGGGIVFLVGILVLALVMVFFARTGDAPLWLVGLALLSPIGFAISFSGLVVQARAHRRD
ncbi:MULTISPECIES: hypothetical protein [unclassified Kineosporia]|uniref:hypothetical protein n=1 Tax=unclassified Kineosporia TaxID=2626061 RepID=UPI000B4ACC7C|nr:MULTISPECIES: hypothetical protein [unclassified Kineosporia]